MWPARPTSPRRKQLWRVGSGLCSLWSLSTSVRRITQQIMCIHIYIYIHIYVTMCCFQGKYFMNRSHMFWGPPILGDAAILLLWIFVTMLNGILIPKKGNMIGVASCEIVHTNIYIYIYIYIMYICISYYILRIYMYILNHVYIYIC